MPSSSTSSILDRTRLALHSELSHSFVTPRVPTVLKPLPVKAAEELPPEQQKKPRGADDEQRCEECGSKDSKKDNLMLLCDGEGCGRGFHMLCLDPPMATEPEDEEWLCPICKPPRPPFMPADEHKMEFTKGTKVWAKDKKGFWGQASVIGYEAATEAPGGSSGSSPVKARARITFKGFSAKFDEWINVGAGCARAHGSECVTSFFVCNPLNLSLSLVCVCVCCRHPGRSKIRPLAEGWEGQSGYEDRHYVIAEIIDVQMKNGRRLYKTTWEGYDEDEYAQA